MKIGIGGLPDLAGNYISALQQAAGACCETMPDAAGKKTASSGAAPLEIEVSTSLIRAVGWDALVLPGGGDIDPALLPGHPAPDAHCSAIDPVLDREQLALLELFLLSRKPVLGICKGMQLIQLCFGAAFCQHLPTAEKHCYQQYDQLHPTHTLPGSFLHQLYGPSFVVNSAHHQGTLCSPALSSFSQDSRDSTITVIQWTDDGVVEGIAHRSLPVIGLQWHPERLCLRHARPDAADGSRIFRYFLSLIPSHI